MKAQIILPVFLATSFFTMSLFAQNTPDVVNIPQQNHVVNEVYEDSSEFHRMNKSYLITAQLIGQGPGADVNKFGATFGKYLNRNSLFTIDFTIGNNGKSSYYYSEYKISDSSIGLSYKNFISNSFYFKVGVDYRKMNYHYTSRDIFNSVIERENIFKSESIVSGLSIGNQWQWQNFTLGCDWVGYSLPIYSHIYDESSTGTSAFAGYMKVDQDRYVKDGVFTALRFYLGASF
jgi:hypothetical protein